MYAPNDSTEKHMKQNMTETKGEISNSTIIFRDLKTLISTTDGTKMENKPAIPATNRI